VIAIVAVIALPADNAIAAEIEQIIVTATKRDRQLQDAPLSVTALTSNTLVDAGVDDIFDAAELVPSFDVAQSAGPLSTSYYIRRIGNLGSIPNFESAVGLFVDGAYRSRNGAALGDLFDLRQVEVVRGPQSTLHGKNTTAGLVSLATNPPGDEFDLHGRLTAGQIDTADSVDSLRLEGVVNAPLTSSTSVRASGVVYRHDDTLINLFSSDSSQNAERYTVRGQLRYASSPNVEARLMVNQFRIDSARLGDFVLFEGNAIRGINEGFGVPCPDHDIDDRLFCRNFASIFDLTSNDVTLNIRYGFGKLELSSISSFEDYESSRDFDADQLNIDVVRIVDRQRGSGFSQELRLGNADDAAVNWLAGIFYLDSAFDRGSATHPTAILGPDAPFLEIVPGVPIGEPGNSGFFVSDSDTRHLSVFGNIDWTISDAISIRTGLRWQTEDKRTTITNTADHTTPTAITLRLMPAFADASLSRSTSGFSWEISGSYRWSEAFMAYLTAARGFKSGGFNAGFGATPPDAREFGDESVHSVELGFKSMLMNERLRLNAALFAARYEDFQSAGWVSLRFLVNNAERVDVSGLEFDLQALLTEHFSAGASLSWVDARYDQYTNGSCHYDRLPDNADGSACDLSGRVLPLAPRTRANLDLVYEQPLRSGSLYGRIDWSWSSDYHTNSTLDPRHIQDSHSLVNARIGFRVDRWDISAWIRNAGDQLVVMREGPSNLFSRDPAYGRIFATPRSYGLTLSARL
jgi:outer membrane receptor protein involved in Fe transport